MGEESVAERSDASNTACSHVRTGVDPARGMWRLNQLTNREKEVFLLLGTGVGIQELAKELGIADRTVKAHVARISEKLGQETRLQCVVLSVIAHTSLCEDSSCPRRGCLVAA
jgi:DNA-binding NarL/FixJ family response regulator